MRYTILSLVMLLSFGTASEATPMFGEIVARGAARSSEETLAGIRKIEAIDAASRRVLGTICVGCGVIVNRVPAGDILAQPPANGLALRVRPTSQSAQASPPRRLGAYRVAARSWRARRKAWRIALRARVAARRNVVQGRRATRRANAIGTPPYLRTRDLSESGVRYSTASSSDNARDGFWMFARPAR